MPNKYCRLIFLQRSNKNGIFFFFVNYEFSITWRLWKKNSIFNSASFNNKIKEKRICFKRKYNYTFTLINIYDNLGLINKKKHKSKINFKKEAFIYSLLFGRGLFWHFYSYWNFLKYLERQGSFSYIVHAFNLGTIS